ncbi:MAG: carbohydrate kinase family protein [Anaerolineales bacterium]|nr:carbohydrate kinase family protein [Anaerolineales bacterium]MCS7248536.1 carbohydrate kinase family protein [Anaerolineales bacterium]MDW8162349.1 carbohydrate kinase family protein [Anaerolineales bacterium]MDW8445996.1 carbohydrate kinase family protein [Anaerolineales bacterium]
MVKQNNFEFRSDGPVVVIGAAGVDIVGRLEGELHEGSSNPARIRITYGGVARNVAENLARLGQAVFLLTAVGQDEYGQRLVESARAAGVDTEYVIFCEDCLTGMYMGILNPKAEILFALDSMEVTRNLTPAYVRKHAPLFKKASFVFIDMNLPSETIRTVFSLAKRYRVPVCADPTSMYLAPRLLPYLAQTFLITPNFSEACLLAQQPEKPPSPPQALLIAKALVSQGVSVVIITLAEQGLCYASSETNGHIPAIQTEILDPTGAGDALTAAVLFALLNEMPLDEAVRLGVSAATLTLRYPGAVVPDLTLEKLYDQLVI